MPLLYLDQNILIQTGRKQTQEFLELKEIIDRRRAQLVLSPAHWLDTAKGGSEENSRMLARFIDSLAPIWLRDPVGLQRFEIQGYLRGAPFEWLRENATCRTVSELVAEIGGTVAGGAAIVSTEVMVVALRNDRQSRAAFAKSYAMNVNANHKNAKAFRDGKITPEVRDKVRLKALRQRSGIQPGSSEDARLREAPWEAFRSLVCEEEATKLMWELKYEMNPNQLHDIWHLVVAMPYTDFIITAEVKLRQMMDAIKNRVAFQTAAIPASIAELFGAI